MKKHIRDKKGITLIALVVTIVVLIILAGVSINLMLGDNGIIKKALESAEEQKISNIKEEIVLELANIDAGNIYDNITVEEKCNRVYDHLKEKNLTSNTKKNGNLLIVNDKYVINLATGEESLQANKEEWNYTIEGTYATIWGYKGQEQKIIIPEYIEDADGKIYPVTILRQTFQSGNFQNNTNLTDITILNNIEKIEDWLFNGCSNLVNVTLPDSIKELGTGVFSQCKSLKTCNIPNKITKIEGRLFENCKSLKNIEIPKSVVSIGECSFAFCTGLEKIEIPSNVKLIGKQAFMYVGNNADTYMGEEYRGNLKEIILNEGIVTIEEEAFTWAETVTKDLKLPSTLVTIGTNAFNKFGQIGGGKIIEYTEEILNSPIQASFFECYMAQDFSEQDWLLELKEWKEMGMKYIIIGETAFKSSSDNKWYSYYPSNLNEAHMHYNSVEKILKYCKQANVKVFISCGNDENTYKYNLCKHDQIDESGNQILGQESFIESTKSLLPFIQEIYDLYYEEYKDILYGWYFPPEVSNNIDWEDSSKREVGVQTLSQALNIIINKVRGLNPNFKLMISPYLNVEEEASWCTRDANVISNYWKEVINKTNFVEEDVLAPQDSANNMQWNYDKLQLYTRAYRQAIENSDKKIQLWSNLEMFVGYKQDIEDLEYIEYGQSTYLKYLVTQIEAERQYVDNFVSCSFCFYYTRPNSISGFYETYKDYLKTGKFETQEPTLPTKAEASTVKVGDKECLNIKFSGMDDNYGIARANIYKNGEFLTYRVSTRLQTYRLNELIGIGYPKSFYDKYFDLKSDEAIYEIELVDCTGNKTSSKFKFKVTSKNNILNVEKM